MAVVANQAVAFDKSMLTAGPRLTEVPVFCSGINAMPPNDELNR
jgi:hypothetical protein